MTGSNPVGQGSNPWGRALKKDREGEPSAQYWAHRPTGGRRRRMPEISVQVRVGPLQCTNGPVAQRRGQLPYKETIGGSSPPRTTRLGRQLADHPDLESGMLWVRLPPGPLSTTTSSWSSLECSPACHAGDRGFKSHRGRLHGTVRQLAERPSSNLGDCGFDSIRDH